jgi:TRAP-type C4-dicarboxylate transport system permease small subunit
MSNEGAATAMDDDQTVDPGADEGLGPEGLGEQSTPVLLPAGGPLRGLFRVLGLVEQAVGVVLILVILALVLVQVAQRYLPGGGWAWTGEIARFAMVWVAFTLAGYLMATDGHIAIKVIDFVLRNRARAVVHLLGHLLIAVTSVVMVYATLEFIANDRGQVTAAAGVPLSIIYAIPAIGFASTALRALLAAVVEDLPQLSGRRVVPA